MNIEQFTPVVVPLEQVSDLWEENDVVIFIVDMTDYPSPDANYLSEAEKVYLDTLKTDHFRNRYITSRIVLKSLSGYLKKRSWSDMVTYKDEKGRVHVCDHNDLHVCISYSGNILALALSKTEVGIDIEFIRPRSVASISKSIDRTLSDSNPSAHVYDFLSRWTLKEAYCKISNETMFSNLSRKLDLSGLYHSSHCMENKYLLAIVTRSLPGKVKVVCLQKIDLSS
ncbi:MAG: 4'-phosphopantetheinyl transferase superfamily protein [Methanomethylovorans sp.]|nr:4'-phosphopantetheinyl transferase superfamily protein [Methanomethylovorans sp.]